MIKKMEKHRQPKANQRRSMDQAKKTKGEAKTTKTKPNITKKVDNIEDIEKKSKQHATDDVNHGTKRRRRR